MKLSREELKGLMKDKLMQAGLHADDAELQQRFLLGLMKEVTILTVP